MRKAGSSSWRFEHDNPQFLHLALFVRDATRLVVTASEDVPPRLAGELPDLAGVLMAAEKAAAADQWLTWWRRLLGQAVREVRQRKAQAEDQDPAAWQRARLAGLEEVFDPPEFRSLADLQPLRTAAVATFHDAVTWSSSRERNSQRQRKWFAWPLVRDAAEQAAAELDISIGDLDAVAYVLDVKGAWSHLAAPGFALCSPEFAADPPAERQLLHDLFAARPGDPPLAR